MDKDPAYRVLTMDGKGWIDPYSGQVVAAPNGHREVALRHLMKARAWEKSAAKLLGELLVARWLHWLRQHIESLPHLRIFAQGQWLNPYTGAWQLAVQLESGKVAMSTLTQMAQVLSQCREAQEGRLIEPAKLEALAASGPQPKARPAQLVARPVPAVRAARPDARRTDFHQIRAGLIKMLARPPRLDGWLLAVTSRHQAAIPREVYDLIELPKRRLLLAVGRVDGEGPGLALFPAVTVKVLRSLASQVPSLIELAVRLGDEIRPDLHQDCRLTLCLALIDLGSGMVTVLSCGHPPALLLNPGRETAVARIGSAGVSIGPASGDALRRQLRPVSFQMCAGDTLMMHGDGLARTANAKGEAFGALRLLGACVANLAQDPDTLCTQVVDAAQAHSGNHPAEDLMLIALRPVARQRKDALGTSWLGGME